MHRASRKWNGLLTGSEPRRSNNRWQLDSGNIRIPCHVAHEVGEATEDALSEWLDNEACSMTGV